MDWAQTATAILGGGVVGGFIGGSLGRATERDKGLREKMIVQATEVVSMMQRAVAMIERKHCNSRPPATDLDKHADSADTNSQELFEQMSTRVVVLHVLFHRQVAWQAGVIAEHLRDAFANPAPPGPNLAEVRREIAIFTEWAGADIRRPSGWWRWDKWARRRFRKHEARIRKEVHP